MALFPKQFVDDVRLRADVVDVIGSRVDLKKSGHDYSARCPFHNENSASFTVSAAKQFYHCFGCGAHGNAIDFLVEFDGMSFIDAVESLARQAGMVIPDRSDATPDAKARQAHAGLLTDILGKARDVFYRNLRDHPNAIDYMKKRGLVKETVKQFGLGYAHQHIADQFPGISTELLIEAGLLTTGETGEVYDKFRRRIMFPIQNERGDVIGFGGRVLNDDKPKYMNSPESPVFQKGAELFGLYFAKQEIRRSRSALLMEGYTDVIMLHQHGDCRAVAALGTSATEAQLSRLYRMCDEIIFCFDGDRAGMAAADRAARLVLSVMGDGKSAKFVTLPPEHDPDSYVRAYGTEQWKQYVINEGVALSAKLLNLIVAGRDVTLPEHRVAVISDALAVLALVRNAPNFHAALGEYIESTVGFELPGLRSVQSKPEVGRPVIVPSTPAPTQTTVLEITGDKGRVDFYRNFALLCCMDATLAQQVPDNLIDDFAALISGWFAMAPDSLIDRNAAAYALRAGQLKDVICDALNSVKGRFSVLSAAVHSGEAAAVLAVINREAERCGRSNRASALFK